MTLELGGKSANVVFADADLEAAAAAAPERGLRQRRPGLLRALADPGRALGASTSSSPRWRRTSSAIAVGDPLDEATEMGPLISAGQRETVASFVPDGAPVAIRGSAPDGPGYWFPPTVLAPVGNDDRAAIEEIFGPVACVIPFDGEARGGARSPTTRSTASRARSGPATGREALRVARAIETGVISINSNTSVRVSTPFGGFKQSGVGRELGPDALEHYTEVKNVYYATEEG